MGGGERIEVGRDLQSGPTGPLAGGELGLITRGIAVRAGAEMGLLAVFGQPDRLVDVRSSWCAAPGGNDLPSSLPSAGFVGRVLDSGHAAVEPINPEQDQSLGIAGSGARLTYAAGAAVRPPGGPPGALCVGFSTPPDDRALTLWMVKSYARLASLCLHDAGTLDGLLAAARLDGLTGCLNYAAIRSELHREIARCARYGRIVSCCFIDLDGFKVVNDRHGHPHGSQMLTEVAAALREGLRIGDTLGRYSGDEFVALLPDTGQTAAYVLAERLRLMISTTTISTARMHVDASVGVAQWRPGWTADDMLAAADAALLKAKRAGGGLVVGADDVTSEAH